MNHILKFRNWLIRNLILLLALPLIILSMIVISYGDIIGNFISEHPDLIKLYQLKNQISVFSSNIELPQHVKCLGYESSILLYILFLVWLAVHFYYSYYKLSHKEGSKSLMLSETVIILTAYLFVVSPKLANWIVLLGYCVIASNILIIILYWIDELKSRNEKE